MRKHLFFFVILSVTASLIYSQDDLLKSANDFYDRDMYKEAQEQFKKLVDSGNISGDILYRYAYSSEILEGLNEDVLKLYAASYSYFKRNNETGSKYSAYAEKKLQANTPSLLNMSDTDADRVIRNLQRSANEIANNLKPEIKTRANGIISYINEDNFGSILVAFLVILLAFYIFALVLSFNTECVIIWGWKDLIVLTLLSIDAIALTVLAYQDDQSHPILIMLFVVFLVLTIIYSIRANITIVPHGVLYIVVSILIKIMMLVIIPLIILLYSSYTSDSYYKLDGRYRDGTKGNIKTKKVTAFAASVAFLVGTLVKGRKVKMVIENNDITFKRDS